MPRNTPLSATRSAAIPAVKTAKPKAKAAAKATVKPAKPKKNVIGRAPSVEQISTRAYEIWLSKGRPIGQDERNWLEAEAQLKLIT